MLMTPVWIEMVWKVEEEVCWRREMNQGVREE